MSNPRLPEELFDHIVDLLYETRLTLKGCSLVSKSWIQRSRKHLFGSVVFYFAADLKSWRESFPDPATSPACYTKTLAILCPRGITAADAEEGGLISTFSRVLSFRLDVHGVGFRPATQLNLLPLYGFSPVLKSLRVNLANFSPSPIPDLIFSFPLLEDISLKAHGGFKSFYMPSVTIQPSSPPAFTGSLELSLEYGLQPVASRLLSLPGNLHFRKLSLEWHFGSDALLTMALVESCRSTLESLRIRCGIIDELPTNPIDLSGATRLEDVTFLCNVNPQWVVMTLKTITSDHRNSTRHTTVDVHSVLSRQDRGYLNTGVFTRGVGAPRYTQWLELDSLLAKLQESHSIRPKVLYEVPSWMSTEYARGYMECLFPEMTRRGVVDGRVFSWGQASS